MLFFFLLLRFPESRGAVVLGVVAVLAFPIVRLVAVAEVVHVLLIVVVVCLTLVVLVVVVMTIMFTKVVLSGSVVLGILLMLFMRGMVV